MRPSGMMVMPTQGNLHIRGLRLWYSGWSVWAILGYLLGGRIVFLEKDHPGRLVSKFVFLVIDFVTAFFNLGVKKTAWWMIKYPRTKKNAQQFFNPASPVSEP